MEGGGGGERDISLKSLNYSACSLKLEQQRYWKSLLRAVDWIKVKQPVRSHFRLMSAITQTQGVN